MNIAQLLEQLETYKQRYNEIANKYATAYYEDTSVHFGSQMWLDVYSDNPTCLQINPNELSKEEVEKDDNLVTIILEEADNLCKENGLQTLLLENTIAYWLGILPEPYTSVY